MSDENENVVPPAPDVPAPPAPPPPPEVGRDEPAVVTEAPVAEPVEPPAAPQAEYLPPPPPPPPPGESPFAPPAPPAAPARGGAAEKNKVVAGVLGILLGGLGIHKFYLGYTNEGIIMLAGNLLWIVGLGWIPNVLGLIEGVIYLFKSDQEFYDTYVVGSKPWL